MTVTDSVIYFHQAPATASPSAFSFYPAAVILEERVGGDMILVPAGNEPLQSLKFYNPGEGTY